MRAIEGSVENCFKNSVPCANLEGMARCNLLRADIVSLKNCPDFFLSLGQLKNMDFKTMIPLLAETDPMQKLTREAAEREATRCRMIDGPERSPVIEELKTHEVNRNWDHRPRFTQIPPLGKGH